jgi:hypothetical protein
MPPIALFWFCSQISTIMSAQFLSLINLAVGYFFICCLILHFFSAHITQYAMQVITSLPPADTGADLSYSKLSDQLDLLSKVSHISSILAVVSGQAAVTYRAHSMKSLNVTCATVPSLP